MVDNVQPRSLSCFRIRKRRHENRNGSTKSEHPRASQHDLGWRARRTTSLLPVAGVVFSLDSPLYRTRLPDISNNAGSVNLFLSALLRSLVRVVLLVLFLPLCINDHGSFVICRANSARPKHLFDQNFDHDYYFKLPFQGAGCPIKWTTL